VLFDILSIEVRPEKLGGVLWGRTFFIFSQKARPESTPRLLRIHSNTYTALTTHHPKLFVTAVSVFGLCLFPPKKKGGCSGFAFSILNPVRACGFAFYSGGNPPPFFKKAKNMFSEFGVFDSATLAFYLIVVVGGDILHFTYY